MHREPWRVRGIRGAVVGGMAAALLIPLLLPGLLWGSDGPWLRLAEESRMVHFVEKGAAARSTAGTREVRLKRLFREPYGERAYSLDTMEVDCGRNLYRYTQVVIHDRDDDVMHRYRLTDQFTPIAPGTIPGRVKEVVCATP